MEPSKPLFIHDDDLTVETFVQVSSANPTNPSNRSYDSAFIIVGGFLRTRYFEGHTGEVILKSKRYSDDEGDSCVLFSMDLSSVELVRAEEDATVFKGWASDIKYWDDNTPRLEPGGTQNEYSYTPPVRSSAPQLVTVEQVNLKEPALPYLLRYFS